MAQKWVKVPVPGKQDPNTKSSVYETSETWEPPQFWKKTRSRSEKATLGATLWWNSGAFSEQFSEWRSRSNFYVKTLFSKHLSEWLSESFVAKISAQILGAFLSKLGWLPRARKLGLPRPPPYMCEIGTMWQIGVLAGKPRTFGVLALQKYGETFEEFGGEMAHSCYLSWCLKKVVFYWNLWHKQSFLVAMAGNARDPSNGQILHRFQVRTRICHIVPVSCAYPHIPPKKGKNHKFSRNFL